MRFHEARAALAACVLLVPCVAGVRAAEGDPSYYRLAATWQETLLLSREALCAAERAESEAAAAPGSPQEGPWQVAGPFAAPEGATAFETAFAPEPASEGLGADLEAALPDGSPLWRGGPAWPDGAVQTLEAGAQAATYLLRRIDLAEARELTLYLGSDDGLTVWWNGIRVLAQDVPRVAAPNQATVAVAGRAGSNEVLLKVNNLSGGHGFYFSLTPAPGAGAAERRAALWPLLARDFPSAEAQREMLWEREDGLWNEDWPQGEHGGLLARYAAATRGEALRERQAGVASLEAARTTYLLSRRADAARAALEEIRPSAVRDAVADLAETFGERYPDAQSTLDRLAVLEAERERALADLAARPEEALVEAEHTRESLAALRDQALLANPLLGFEKLLVIRRRGDLGLPANWQGNSSIAPAGYDNDLAILSPVRPDGALTTRYRPEAGRFIGDLDLSFDATKLLCSIPDDNLQWQVQELPVDGGAPTRVTPNDQPDIANSDGCYLPDGRVIFCSTACVQGVPCVSGSDKVASLYLLDRASGAVRQLTFDQDHSWDPTVLPSGRVLYERWEYSDTPHYFSRLLFSMNPDGTTQTAMYGSNSYWPNSLFYVRPVPGDSSKLIAIVTGHHGERREGELTLIDPTQGEHEARGALQRIPFRGKEVEPKIEDQLVAASWPRFLHPYPLSEKYFLVSCRPTPQSDWGIYLADVFDNLVPVRIEPGAALLEPTPVLPRPTPPVVPDRANPARKDALVYIGDLYAGPGLDGVPRGSAKALRIYSPHYTYWGVGGHIHIGIDGPWDVKRILGTVPVEPDGSALFRVPANTPFAVEPLDEQGQALQLMRSWMTAMPGETLTCSGCHEPQREAVTAQRRAAAFGPVREIEPWHGPTRGFSFKREVQPVLDRYCVGCHDGSGRAGTSLDLRQGEDAQGWRGFTPSYIALHPYVRRPGPESDYHLQAPMEFGADTSELVRMLRKGHHDVRLDAQSWDRIVTWIDLNVPCHGTWSEHQPIPGDGRERRLALRSLYAGVTEDPEAIPEMAPVQLPPAPTPVPSAPADPVPACDGWPFAEDRARSLQEAEPEVRRTVDLGGGVSMEFVRVPAGSFVVGDPDGAPDERPLALARVDRPFWVSVTEVTNAQYACFDAAHDSGYISESNKDQTRRGAPVNEPRQPVLRVSWAEAEGFCRWLGERAGLPAGLPSEAQWEWACRAGSDAPLAFGGPDADFSAFANLADRSLAGLARADSPPWMPRDDRFSDGATVTREVGSYRPNAWGLHDMHGNVSEWTRSLYRPYPYNAADGREDLAAEGPRVVRGGSFYTRPKDARSGWRWGYLPWRKVFDVGFRVVLEP